MAKKRQMKKEEEQMDIFEQGGLNDEGGTVDPVSGNDVPSGSTQSEVRDDIPAQLSEGEFVLPADVVRYIGLENIMKMRDMAKEGLQKMEDMGQMGNSEEAVIPDTVDFDADIDRFIEELDSEDDDDDARQNFQVGGLAGMNQRTTALTAPTATQGFLPPGVTMPGQGTNLPEAPVITPGGPAGGVPGSPTYETKQYIGPNGEIRSFTFINGEPVTPIPEGFTLYDPSKIPEAATGVPTAQVSGDGGDGRDDTATNVDPVVGTARALAQLNPESTTGKAVGEYNSRMLKTGAGAAASVLSGNLPGLALSAYRGYKANKELKDTVGSTLAENNPTLSAVLSSTENITTMSERDVADSVYSGVNAGMSPGLAAAITASGGKISTTPAVTDIDVNTGQQTTRQGQTSIQGLTGGAESAVREMYGESLANSNPTAYRDMVEEAAFYDATGLGVMSTAPRGGIDRDVEPTAPTAGALDSFMADVEAEAAARGMPSDLTSLSDLGGTSTFTGTTRGVDPNVGPAGARSLSTGPVAGQYDIDTLTASTTTPTVARPAVSTTPSPTETARSIAETERQARDVSSGDRDLGGSDFGSRGEADAVSESGWGSDDHFDSIDAQFDSLDDDDDGGGGDDDGGRYCCSRMVHHDLWTVEREFARLSAWSRKQPNWWRSGYPVWGKIVAKYLLGKEGFWTGVMQAFYDNHVMKKPRSLKSTLADVIIFPGSFVCGLIWKDIPQKSTLADPREFN